MQAYIFQVMTDLHGDIPFKDALKAGKGIIAPAYNTQQEVYDGLITLVNDGIALIDEVTTNHPGTDDFFYHGDMHQWKKFANTLKLKIYLRQVYVRSTVGAFCLPCLSIMLSIDIFVPSKRVFRMWFASI